MATSPIGAGQEIIVNPSFEDLANDQLLEIFKDIVTNSYVICIYSLSRLTVVCRRWKEISERMELGLTLFRHLSYTFPKDAPDQWRAVFNGHARRLLKDDTPWYSLEHD